MVLGKLIVIGAIGIFANHKLAERREREQRLRSGDPQASGAIQSDCSSWGGRKNRSCSRRSFEQKREVSPPPNYESWREKQMQQQQQLYLTSGETVPYNEKAAYATYGAQNQSQNDFRHLNFQYPGGEKVYYDGVQTREKTY